MGDPRPPKERTFTPEDVAHAASEGKVYDATLVDFVPVQVPEAEATLLAAAGWTPPTTTEAGGRPPHRKGRRR